MKLIEINGVRGYIDENGTAQLNLEDISRGLGFIQNKNNVAYVRWDRVNGYLSDMGFPQLVGKDFIPENVFYRLSMKGETESAINFQSKVADEILPSIRKTGSYSVQHRMPQSFAEALEGYAAQLRISEALDNERKQLAAKVETDRPMVLFAESVQVSADSILIGELAKLLKQNDINIGGTRLFKLLREEGYLMSKGDQYNMPTQRSMDLKIMEIKPGTRGGSNGAVHITRTTKITGKGQIYFINKFKNALHLVK
jgi:phage antirepressor YoqD-like protein